MKPRRTQPQAIQPILEGALCVHRPDLFGPDTKHNDKQAKARAICGHCPAFKPCGEWALNDKTLKGVLGAMTYAQRARLMGWRKSW